MFTNLIESNSHKREFKRRSSFFVATVAAYALVLTAAGIVGILTYDARVEAQDMDFMLGSWIPPVKPPAPTVRPDRTRPARAPVRSNAPVDQHITVPERTAQVPPVDDTRVTPPDIGITGPTSPPIEGPVNITNRNVNPSGSADEKNGCAACTGVTQGTIVAQPTPEPTPIKPPPVQQVSKGVLIAKVISMPTPAYPLLAKQVRASGPVNVQILIDETGNVINAHAVNGHPMLIRAAEDAARRARFTPTLLSNQPVKVQGVITYNFVLQ